MSSRDYDTITPVNSARRQMTPGFYRDHSLAGLLDDISQIARQRLHRVVGFGYVFHWSPPEFLN
jgi:hypothetical protein